MCLRRVSAVCCREFNTNDDNVKDDFNYEDVYGEEDEKDYDPEYDDYEEMDPQSEHGNIVRRSADPQIIIRPSGDGMYGPDGGPRVVG